MKKYQKDFLNYCEGTLSEEARVQFERALHESEELQAELEAYRQILHLEKLQAMKDYELDERFVSKVMAQIKHEPSIFWRLFDMIPKLTKKWQIGLSTMAIAAICFAFLFNPQILHEIAQGPQAEVAPVEQTKIHNELDKEDASEEATSNVETSPTSPLTAKIPQGYSADQIDAMIKQHTDQAAAAGSPGGSVTVDELSGANLGSQQSNRRPNIEGTVNIQGNRFYVQDGRLEPADLAEATSGSSAVELSHPVIRQETNMPYPQGRDQFLAVTENKPTLTKTESMSTFSIDVDTGSYTNARRYLEQGTQPPPDSVRIEEFINYFSYQYAEPKNKEPFATSFELAPSPGSDGKVLLKIGIKARDLARSEESKPWNLVFLVDVSGSMMPGDRLPLIQRALEVLVQGMRPQDRVSLVTYAGNAAVALEPTGVNEREKILSAIRSLGAGGSTHGSAGIEQAYALAERSFIANGVNRVILTTDGDFNVGTTNRDDLIRIIEAKRQKGITLTTLGVGAGNYNEAVMEQIANKGNGNYFYLDSFAEARKVFQQDLMGTMEVVAKDVKLQIEFNPEHVQQYRLIGYENRALKNEEFANDRIDAGEIGAGHRVTALYELVLTGSEAARRLAPEYRYGATPAPEVAEKPAPDSQFGEELAFLKIRHKEPNGDVSKEQSFPVSRSMLKSNFDDATKDFRFLAAVSAFAHKLRQSQHAPNLSMQQIAEMAEAAIGEDVEGYRREFVKLVKNAAAVQR
jgi:Ca-activated chloride channel family protein